MSGMSNETIPALLIPFQQHFCLIEGHVKRGTAPVVEVECEALLSLPGGGVLIWEATFYSPPEPGDLTLTVREAGGEEVELDFAPHITLPTVEEGTLGGIVMTVAHGGLLFVHTHFEDWYGDYLDAQLNAEDTAREQWERERERKAKAAAKTLTTLREALRASPDFVQHARLKKTTLKVLMHLARRDNPELTATLTDPALQKLVGELRLDLDLEPA